MNAARTTRPGFLKRIFSRKDSHALIPLYNAVVAEGRQPHWYRQGAVPDTIDGRFDMIALVLSLVLIRLERDGHEADAVRLTEVFVDDMDGQVREIGFGDLVVGKQVGRIMSALGGRLGAYRDRFDEHALIRNVYRGAEPAPAALAHLRGEADALRARIDAAPLDALLAGRLG